MCYRGADGKLYQPSEHIYGAMIKAASNFKFENRSTMGGVIKGGIVVSPDMLSLNRDKWDEIDARPVVIQRARVVKWRPRFNEWEVSFDIEIIDEDNLSDSILREILDRAGKYKGIGDYRPRFGRFMVNGWEVEDIK